MNHSKLLIVILSLIVNQKAQYIRDARSYPNLEPEVSVKCGNMNFNWKFLKDNGRCRAFSPFKCFCIDVIKDGNLKSYAHSRESCREMGGYLAHVDSRELLEWIGNYLYTEMVQYLVPPVKEFKTEDHSYYKNSEVSGLTYEAYIGLEKMADTWVWVKNEQSTPANMILWHPFKRALREHSYGTIYYSRLTIVPTYYAYSDKYETVAVKVNYHIGHSSHRGDDLGVYVCQYDTQQSDMSIKPGVPCNKIGWMWDLEYYTDHNYILSYCDYFDSACYCALRYDIYKDGTIEQQHNFTWQHSKKICEKMKGRLAQPKTIGQVVRIANMMDLISPPQEAYIGLRKSGSLWNWVSDQEEVPATDIVWDSSMSKEGNYATINYRLNKPSSSAKIRKADGTEKDGVRMFICEYKDSMPSIVTTTTTLEPTTQTPKETSGYYCDQMYDLWMEYYTTHLYTTQAYKCKLISQSCFCQNVVYSKNPDWNMETYDFAERACIAMDGILAIVDTTEKSEQLAKWLEPSYFNHYVGLRNKGNGWMWSDGSKAENIPWLADARLTRSYGCLVVPFWDEVYGLDTSDGDLDLYINLYICEHRNILTGPRDTSTLTCDELNEQYPPGYALSGAGCEVYKGKCYCRKSVSGKTDSAINYFQFAQHICHDEMGGTLPEAKDPAFLDWITMRIHGESPYISNSYVGLERVDGVWMWTSDNTVAENLNWFKPPKPSELYGYLKFVSGDTKFASTDGMEALHVYQFICEHKSFIDTQKPFISSWSESERLDPTGLSCDELNQKWNRQSVDTDHPEAHCKSFNGVCYCSARIIHYDLDLAEILNPWEYSKSVCGVMGAKLAKAHERATVDWLASWNSYEDYLVFLYIGLHRVNSQWKWSSDDSFASNIPWHSIQVADGDFGFIFIDFGIVSENESGICSLPDMRINPFDFAIRELDDLETPLEAFACQYA